MFHCIISNKFFDTLMIKILYKPVIASFKKIQRKKSNILSNPKFKSKLSKELFIDTCVTVGTNISNGTNLQLMSSQLISCYQNDILFTSLSMQTDTIVKRFWLYFIFGILTTTISKWIILHYISKQAFIFICMHAFAMGTISHLRYHIVNYLEDKYGFSILFRLINNILGSFQYIYIEHLSFSVVLC